MKSADIKSSNLGLTIKSFKLGTFRLLVTCAVHYGQLQMQLLQKGRHTYPSWSKSPYPTVESWLL